jgi:hypothetical protein
MLPVSPKYLPIYREPTDQLLVGNPDACRQAHPVLLVVGIEHGDRIAVRHGYDGAGQRFSRGDAHHQQHRQNEIFYVHLRSLTRTYSKTPRAENSLVISSSMVCTTRMDTKDDRKTYSTSIAVARRARPRSRFHPRHGDCPTACQPPDTERGLPCLLSIQARSYNSLTNWS